jgi:hypothetical protein
MAFIVQGLGRKLTQGCRLMSAAPDIPLDLSADYGAPPAAAPALSGPAAVRPEGGRNLLRTRADNR